MVLVEGPKNDVKLMKHLFSLYGIDEEYEIPAKVALELLKQEYSVAMLVKKSNAYKKSPCKQSEQTKSQA